MWGFCDPDEELEELLDRADAKRDRDAEYWIEEHRIESAFNDKA